MQKLNSDKKNSDRNNDLKGKVLAIWAVWLAFWNTLSFGTLAVVFSFIPVIGRHLGEWMIWIWARIFLFFTRIRVDYFGMENIKNQHAIFMSNHQSYLDSMILYNKLKRIKFVILDKFKTYPIFGWGLYLQGHLFIKPGVNRKALLTIKRAVQKLKKGTSILLFPEGSRNKEMIEFRKGGFKMALQSGLPIIPVAISGSYIAMPKGKFRLFPRRVAVVFGRPIDTLKYTEQQIDELVGKVREEIFAQLKTVPYDEMAQAS